MEQSGAVQKTDEQVIEETRAWLLNVVIGCNFCPFAAREFKRNAIQYTLVRTSDKHALLTSLALEFERLDNQPEVETSLLILPGQFNAFNDYLNLIDLCQDLLEEEGREGIYQIASFHPAYLFAGSDDKDPANYTNQSPYPMIHILREESLTRVLEKYPDPESIPENNIAFARKQGLAKMKDLWTSCFLNSPK